MMGCICTVITVLFIFYNLFQVTYYDTPLPPSLLVLDRVGGSRTGLEDFIPLYVKELFGIDQEHVGA